MVRAYRSFSYSSEKKRKERRNEGGGGGVEMTQ